MKGIDAMSTILPPEMLSCNDECRFVLLSCNLEPVSCANAYTQNEVTFARIEHRTLATTVYRFVSGEDVQILDVSSYEVEQLMSAYRRAKPAHKKLLSHAPQWDCAEGMLPY
jgi:hypothetical protein